MLPTERETSPSYGTLRAVQCVLAAIVVGLCVVGRSEHYWPLTGWPLYESIRIGRPDASVNAVYVRVVLRDGTAHELPADKLVEYSRAGLIPITISAATQRDDTPARRQARKHLAHLVALKLGTTAFDSVSVSERVWSVNLERVPPVEVSRPVMTVPVAHFAVPR